MRVSVVIPVYNAEKFLEEAVKSALEQEETAEVVLAEDNSSDGSLNVCIALEEKHDAVLMVRHPDLGNHGAGATRNLALRNASMEYVAFLDADDIYLTDRFKVASDLFRRLENIDGVYEAIGVCFEDEEAEARWNSRKEGDITTLSRRVDPGELCDLLLEGENGTFSLDGLTVRRDIFDKCGCFFENLRLHQDTAMIIQMAQFGDLYPGRLDSPVTLRRVHEGNRFLAEYNHYLTSNLMWRTLLSWAFDKEIQPRRVTAVYLNYIYYLSCLALGRRSCIGMDLDKLQTLIFQVIKHPVLFLRALGEHRRRKRQGSSGNSQV